MAEWNSGTWRPRSSSYPTYNVIFHYDSVTEVSGNKLRFSNIGVRFPISGNTSYAGNQYATVTGYLNGAQIFSGSKNMDISQNNQNIGVSSVDIAHTSNTVYFRVTGSAVPGTSGSSFDRTWTISVPEPWTAPTQTFRTYAKNNQTGNATDSGNKSYTDKTWSVGATGYVGDTFIYTWDKNDQANVGKKANPSSLARLCRSDSNNYDSSYTTVFTAWNETAGDGDLYVSDHSYTSVPDDGGKYLQARIWKYYKNSSGNTEQFIQSNGHYIQPIPTMSVSYKLRSHRFYKNSPSLGAVTFNSVSITTNGYRIHNRYSGGGLVNIYSSTWAAGAPNWSYGPKNTYQTANFSLNRVYQLYSAPTTVTSCNSTDSGVYVRYQSPNLTYAVDTGYDVISKTTNDFNWVDGSFNVIVAKNLTLMSPASIYPTSKETTNFIVNWEYDGTQNNVRGDYRIESSSDGVTWNTEAISGSTVYKDWISSPSDVDRSSTGWVIDQSGTNYVFVGVKLSTAGLYYRITLIPSSTDSAGYQIFGKPIQLITPKIYRIILPVAAKTEYITSILPPIAGLKNDFYYRYQTTTNWGNYNDNTTFGTVRRHYYDSTHYNDYIDYTPITASTYVPGVYNKTLASNATGAVSIRVKPSVKVSDWGDTEFTGPQSNYKQINIIAQKAYKPTATEFKITTPLQTTLLRNIPFTLKLPDKTINGNSLINSGNIYVDGAKSSEFSGLTYKLGDLAGWGTTFVAGNTTLGQDGTCISMNGDRTIKFDSKTWDTDTLTRGAHTIKIDMEILTYFDSDGTRKVSVPSRATYTNLAKAVTDSSWVLDGLSSQVSKVTGHNNSQALPVDKKYYNELTNLVTTQPTGSTRANTHKFTVTDTNGVVSNAKIVYTNIHDTDTTLTGVSGNIVSPIAANLKTNIIYGNSSYTGTPSPSSPVTIKGVGTVTEKINSTSYTLNNGSNILHGFSFAKDEYNVITGKITKNIYEYTITGNEDFVYFSDTSADGRFHIRYDSTLGLSLIKHDRYCFSTHFATQASPSNVEEWGIFDMRSDGYLIFFDKDDHFNKDVTQLKNWFKAQASAGKPVKIYYQLATAQTISVTAKNIAAPCTYIYLSSSALSLADSTKDYFLYGNYSSTASSGRFNIVPMTSGTKDSDLNYYSFTTSSGSFSIHLGKSASAASSLFFSVALDATYSVSFSNLVLVELSSSIKKSGSNYIDYNGATVTDANIVSQGFFTGKKVTNILRGYSFWKNSSLASITNGKKYYIMFEAKSSVAKNLYLKRGSTTVVTASVPAGNTWKTFFTEWIASGSGSAWSFDGPKSNGDIAVDGLFIMDVNAFQTSINAALTALNGASVTPITVDMTMFQKLYTYNATSSTYNFNVENTFNLPVNHVLFGSTGTLVSNILNVEIGDKPLAPTIATPDPSFFYAGASRNLTWKFTPGDWGVTDTTYNARQYEFELYKVGTTDTKITSGTLTKDKTSYTYTFTPLNSNIGVYKLKLRQKNVLGTSDWSESTIEILKAIEPGFSEITTSELIALDAWGWDLSIKPGNNGSYAPVTTAPITRAKVDVVKLPTNLYNGTFSTFDSQYITKNADGWYHVSANNTGSAINYIDFWSSRNQYLKPDTTYTYVFEYKNVVTNKTTSLNIGNSADDVNFAVTQFKDRGSLSLTTGSATRVKTFTLTTREDMRYANAYCSRDFINLPAGCNISLDFRVSLIEGTVDASKYSWSAYKDPFVVNIVPWTNYNNLQTISRHTTSNFGAYVDGTYSLYVQYDRNYTTQTVIESKLFQIVPPEVMLYNRSHAVSYNESTDRISYMVQLESFAATTKSEAWYSLDYGKTWTSVPITKVDGAIRTHSVNLSLSWLDEIHFKMHGINPVIESNDTWVDELPTGYRVWLSWANRNTTDYKPYNKIIPILTMGTYSTGSDGGTTDIRFERYMWTADKIVTTNNRGCYLNGFSTELTNGERYRIEFKAKGSRGRNQEIRVECGASLSTKTIAIDTDYKKYSIDFTYNSASTYKGLTFYSTSWLPEERFYIKEVCLRKLNKVKNDDFIRRISVSYNGTATKKVCHIDKF